MIQGLENAGFVVDKSIKDTYEKYIADDQAKKREALKGNPMAMFMPLARPEEIVPSASSLQANVAAADIAVITLAGRPGGRQQCC